MITFDTERCTAWLLERLKEKGVLWDHAFGCVMQGELVAAVGYCHFDGRDIELTVAADGRATPSFLRAMFRYPFEQLGCARVTAHADPRNARSVFALERMGFVLEGSRRGAAHDGGEMLLFGLLKQECRYL